jgi:hypothetical protein
LAQIAKVRTKANKIDVAAAGMGKKEVVKLHSIHNE